MRRFVLVTGAPASGKTRLARELAERLQLPFFGRDVLKELLFDSLGYSDREWSRKLGGASFDLLYAVARELLRGEQPFILESNFKPQAVEKFRVLTEEPIEVFQVLTGATPAVLIERFQHRHESGERHPGHVDDTNVDVFLEGIADGWYAPLDLPGEVLRVDTTDFQAVNYEHIATSVREWLRGRDGEGEAGH